MPKLSDFIPKNHPCVEKIYAHYKKQGDAEQSRGYLGASIIGHKCERYLWYLFRYCTKEEFPGRLYRLFDTGNGEEERIVKDLRAIGCTVYDLDPATGKQFEINNIGGHFSGHFDAALAGLPGCKKTWHVGEFKTHNGKSYKKLIAVGVKISKPVHYAQMQAYMCKTGMRRALYVAVNKDTDEIWIERVYYDGDFCLGLMAKANRIIFATEAPERITNRQDWYECKFCSAHSLCWGIGETVLPVPAINCRQCCHATPKLDGQARWVCEKHGRGLSPIDQTKCCDDHLVLPSLLSQYEPSGYKKDANGAERITFTHIDTKESWVNGKRSGEFLSREVCNLSFNALASTFLARTKKLFGAKTAGDHDDKMFDRYLEYDSRIIWRGPARDLEKLWEITYKENLSDLVPVSKCDGFDYQAVEFNNNGMDGGRVAIVWAENNVAEIREGIA